MNFRTKLEYLLIQTVNACKGQILQLITKIYKLRTKKVIYHCPLVSMLLNYFWPYFLNFCTKLECLSVTCLFQFSLMFVGKARNLPQNGAPERCFICIGSSITSKYQTSLERLARDKHSSVLRKFVNYGQKKFYNIGPRSQFYKNSLLSHRRCGKSRAFDPVKLSYACLTLCLGSNIRLRKKVFPCKNASHYFA